MITKQQALEFIYELSKRHKIKLDLTYGYIGVDGSDEDGWNFSAYANETNSLEATVTQLIKENLNPYSILLEYVDFPIPVDVSMLEVGQTYKVHIQEDWDHRFFTAKFLGFDEEDTDVVKFEDNRPCTKFDFREIYKVNEHANM